MSQAGDSDRSNHRDLPRPGFGNAVRSSMDGRCIRCPCSGFVSPLLPSSSRKNASKWEDRFSKASARRQEIYMIYFYNKPIDKGLESKKPFFFFSKRLRLWPSWPCQDGADGVKLATVSGLSEPIRFRLGAPKRGVGGKAALTVCERV